MEKIAHIPFTEIESIPLLIKDFLTQKLDGFESQLFTFYHLEAQLTCKGASYAAESRDLLSRSLTEQYKPGELTPSQQKNIDLLKQENAFTVTTGHQLNLFTGPAYFIYKILQTIKLAKEASLRFPQYHIIPIFWLATEDHDFDEINHFKTAGHYYEMKARAGGAVGRITVEDHFFIEEFKKEFQDSIYGTEMILLLERAYKKGNTLTEATRIVVQELFGDFGLLAIDGDDQLLKSQIKNTFRQELLHRELAGQTAEMVAVLGQRYGKVQVNPREINLFYLSDTRNRISFENGEYVIVDKGVRFSETAILAELDRYPERFSPNALMRPVFQETVLPNLAYVGGNAEIMYWLELKKYFSHLHLPFPLLIPRNSVLMLTEKTVRKAAKLNLNMSDFFINFAQVTRNSLLENNGILIQLKLQEQALEKQFHDLKELSQQTDASFGNMVDAEQTRQLKSFARFRKRLLRAEKIKQNEKLQRLEDIFREVHPGNTWQERTLNFSQFYGDLGKGWLYDCYEQMDVEKSELIIFTV